MATPARKAKKHAEEPKRPPKPSRRVKQLWRRSAWLEYQVPYDVVVAKDGTTGKPITRQHQATRYRRLKDAKGRPIGPSLRAWARRSKDPDVRAWAERKGL